MADQPQARLQTVVIVPQAKMTEAFYRQPFSAVVAQAKAEGLRVLECDIAASFPSRAGGQKLLYSRLAHSPEKGNHWAYEDLTGFAVLRGDPKTDQTFLLGQR